MQYMIWNNKGGVGKTFLTYCLAVEYAKENPEKQVLVVDACPQANISEMLLGGNGKGEQHLELFIENERTIAAYIKERYRSRQGRLGTEIDYFVQVNTRNENMPPNLYLLPGDIDLDVCSSIIDYLAQAPERKAWIQSRFLLHDLIDSFNKASKKELVCFIDCNPSFANYTQMAVLASDRIIVPCTADFASRKGFSNILHLIYGISNEVLQDEVFNTFYRHITDAGIRLPKIHSVILNKTRTQSASPASAYKTHVELLEKNIMRMRQENPHCFTDTMPTTLELKDANTLAVVLAYNGLAVSELQDKSYPAYKRRAKVNQSQIYPFKENLAKIIESLAD